MKTEPNFEWNEAIRKLSEMRKTKTAMKTDVIITGFSNANSEGVVLHTNIPAKLKTGNVKGRTVWVSWDKIGENLFDDYTKETDVKTLNEIRRQ